MVQNELEVSMDDKVSILHQESDNCLP
jgi:hypothetical protein